MTKYAPSLPAIPKRYDYKANKGKTFGPVKLPFERSPRCIKEIGKIPFCYWYVPRIDDYGLACRIGMEYAAHFVQFLKDDPSAVPNNILGHIMRDIDFEDDSDAKGYWVGFLTELSQYLLKGTKRMDVFAELDKDIAEEKRACADYEATS
ncbi:MAG TPA: hypothetical protein VHB01_13515 [Nitrosospira sp.]|nr:hypothetical protein [Nitrosospira sp.]